MEEVAMDSGTQGTGAKLATNSEDEKNWDRLILFIEKGLVIPILGPELSLTQTATGSDVLNAVLARQLAERFNVNPEGLNGSTAISEAAARCIHAGHPAQDIPLELYQLVEHARFEPSEPLRQIAEISDFNLIVTTALDTMLESALRETRGIEVTSLAYAPNDIQDLDGPRKDFHQPVVYHLLGKPDIARSFAVTEEDILEFFYALESPLRQPKQLFYELASNHLLFIGGGYPDWLVRFFLRAAKGEHRLSEQRGVREYFADRQVAANQSLVMFLHDFSKPTHVFKGEEPVHFVAELHRRWRDRNPAKLKPAAPRMVSASARPPAEVPEMAVFVSYAREDHDAVVELASGLQAAKIPFWFDLDRLEAGDVYEAKIRHNIERSALFLPIISRNTDRAARDRFFRREWKWALEHCEGFLPDEPFIVPIFIDDTPVASARVPDRFLDFQIVQLPGGHMTEDFAGQLRKLLATTAKAPQP